VLRAACALALAALASACSPPSPDAGYVVYQTVFLDRGVGTEQRLQVMEDARLTPGMRAVMWDGPKGPDEVAKALGLPIDDAAIVSLAKDPVKPAMLRLTDAKGNVLAERRFDCPLGQLNDTSLPQAAAGGAVAQVWALGIDCHTATGVYEGLVTRLFTLADNKFVWQKFRDPAGGDPIELTLLDAPKVGWRLASPGRVEDIEEVSGQPDMNTLAPNGVPRATIIDYVRYRFVDGLWTRSDRTVPGDWQSRQAFPSESDFPK
jgi:hypothetical protein